jgi:alkylation response protein AidB-like acyl-CoA dehydrogenase
MSDDPSNPSNAIDSTDLDAYRARARAWLAANLPSGEKAGLASRGAREYTREDIESQRPLQRALHEAGYAGITWPVEYGGQGLTAAHERIFNEEAAGYLLPDFGIAGGTTFSVCAPVMLAHGSEDLKRRHLPRMLSGEELWVQFFSEPGAGSDLAGVQTRAERDGDDWVLNGAKVWSSFAHLADWGMCLARTDWTVPKHRGLTWFGVRTDLPGVTVRPIRQINGGADFCEEFFDDVVVPDSERIGDVDAGWTVAGTMLVFERGAGLETAPPGRAEPGPLAPDLVAIARDAGRLDDPVARQLIATAHSHDFLRQELDARLAVMMQQTTFDAGVAAYGALAMGVFDAERACIGMEIGRGNALAWSDNDGPGATTALAYLNGRMMSIASGTNEMQRNGIGERVLGLPREPSFDRDKPFEQVVRDAHNWTGRT